MNIKILGLIILVFFPFLFISFLFVPTQKDAVIIAITGPLNHINYDFRKRTSSPSKSLTMGMLPAYCEIHLTGRLINVDFNVEDLWFDKLEISDFKKNVAVGDEVILYIDKKDFQSILKVRNQSPQVRVYGIESKGVTYLDSRNTIELIKNYYVSARSRNWEVYVVVLIYYLVLLLVFYSDKRFNSEARKMKR